MANFVNTDAYWQAMADLVRPQGRICCINRTSQPLDLTLLQDKSAHFAWEFMFTRSLSQTPDMQRQHELLNKVASLLLVWTGLSAISALLSLWFRAFRMARIAAFVQVSLILVGWGTGSISSFSRPGHHHSKRCCIRVNIEAITDRPGSWRCSLVTVTAISVPDFQTAGTVMKVHLQSGPCQAEWLTVRRPEGPS
jgi:hypothetical protein